MKLSNKLKILVVDDCSVTTTLIKGLLRKKGFQNIAVADNGKDALAELISARNTQEEIELLLLDWNMPRNENLIKPRFMVL
jgi:CheY-like chemotaxis protein